MQADDQQRLFLDKANPYDPVNPVTTSLVEIGQQWWFKSWRTYYHQDPTENQGKFVTDLLDLEAGKYYKLRAQHKDTGGSMWGTWSVEFMQPGSESHPMASKAVQSWKIEQENIPEQWTITINNPGTGKFKLSMKSPKETTSWLSGEITANTSADGMRSGLIGFYNNGARANSNIAVTRTMYDAGGLETTVLADAKKFIYKVKVVRRITGYSFTAVSVLPIGTISSQITVQKPSDAGGIASSPPMSGKFTIQCQDKAGTVHTSQVIDYNQWDEGIRVQFLNTPFLRGKVRIQEIWGGGESAGWPYAYRENGKHLLAIFDGFNENPPLCNLVTDTTNPIVGGNNIQFKSEVIRAYGQSLMFEPVGLEFLYSDAQTPQVLVNVDGLPALCVNLNCDYAYKTPVAQITAQSYNEATKELVVTGTSLPTTGVTLNFGGAHCIASTPSSAYTDTQITCTLDHAPRAGDHKAEIRDAKGLIPFGSGVADITIALTVTSKSISTANAMGGDVLTITGTGFPILKSEVSVLLKTTSD